MTVLAPTTAKAVLDVARSQLGVSEQPPGSNLNPYGAWYGMNGVAWCDEFFSWTDFDAGWKDAPHFAATTTHAAWFQKNGAWLTRDQTPPAGAAIFYDWGHGIAHIGRWEGLLADGRISSIEGNTDSAGGSSGGRVMRQYRSRALIAGFGVITYQSARPALQEDDMACIYSLNEKLTYPGLGDLAPGYAVYVVGNVREHVDSAATQNQRVHDGCPARGVSALEMAAILDMTVDKIQRLIKT